MSTETDILMKISANTEVLLAKLEDTRADISYLSAMKNKHEERISSLEKSVPNDLEKRLRDVEMKTYLISTIVPLIISTLMKFVFN